MTLLKDVYYNHNIKHKLNSNIYIFSYNLCIMNLNDTKCHSWLLSNIYILNRNYYHAKNHTNNALETILQYLKCHIIECRVVIEFHKTIHLKMTNNSKRIQLVHFFVFHLINIILLWPLNIIYYDHRHVWYVTLYIKTVLYTYVLQNIIMRLQHMSFR